MAATRRSISVLRFCAGEMHLGVAAEDVVAVVAAQEGTIHVAEALGVKPGVSTSEQRGIHLSAPLSTTPGTASGHAAPIITFRADPPVEVLRCNLRDILPLPSGLPARRCRPVMGVAHIDEQTILLLDIPSLIERLSDRVMPDTPRGEET